MALLQYRNTPDRDTRLSPAQVLFARHLRDAIPGDPSSLKLRKEWILTVKARETALARRHHLRGEDLNRQAHPLSSLPLGTVVQVQNQTGAHANKWDKSGTIVEVMSHESYMVKLDGSGRVTKRNRRFLRPIIPYADVLAAPGVSWSPQDTHINLSNPQNTGGIQDPQDNQSNDSSPLINHTNYDNLGTSGERALPDRTERARPQSPPSQPSTVSDAGDTSPRSLQDPFEPDPALDEYDLHRRPLMRQTSVPRDCHSATVNHTLPSADDTPLPALHAAPANESPPSSNSRAEPQHSPQPSPQPAPRRGARVRFKPQPLVVGDPKHPYWQAHHQRPRIPSLRGEGR